MISSDRANPDGEALPSPSLGQVKVDPFLSLGQAFPGHSPCRVSRNYIKKDLLLSSRESLLTGLFSTFNVQMCIANL